MRLYLVPSPIGNLGDITYRAVETLRNADVILCEDTRTSGVLLRHYGILKPLTPYHAHNEHKVLPHLIEQIQEGKVFALITDAGTPGISDPGFLLVRECVRNNIPVECLPGATAFVPALVQSGLPASRFVFEGFLPLKKGRQTMLKMLAEEQRTVILYESPHRLVKTLNELATYFGSDRQAAVCRELTKMFEETNTNTLTALSAHYEKHPPKGEIVIVIEGAPARKGKYVAEQDAEEEDIDQP
ncbi:MAG: 16S rRNA (cytidine(1402)-2'-O)-methyltransferase [Taibaiella sp.]|nr:16S rRNA (cytidine(1402)-2'-O)-methyltransferase [Taibaiella sp.]